METIKITQELIDALRSQEQADFDGIMVKVSRQACDEAAAILQLILDQQEQQCK